MRKLAIGALAFGILAAMGGVRAVELRRSYASTVVIAETRASNLAQLLAAYITQSFASGDAALRQLTLHSLRVGGPAAPAADWGPSLRSARAGLAGVGSISIVDAQGVIRHSTRPDLVGQTRAGETTFVTAMADTSDALLAGLPLPTTDADTGVRRFIIPIGRRLRNNAGESIGAVVASFEPDNARDFFHGVDVGARGTIWILHDDGIVLFREPSETDPIGQTAVANPLFRASRNAPSGLVRSPLVSGGPVQIGAFLRVTAPPLVVAVALDRDETLTAWTREAVGSAPIFGVVALLLTAMLLMLYRQMDAMEAALVREQAARRQAESANALKEQFLMTVSHELRTPLTAIQGWARMLTQGVVTEEQRGSAMRTIERNAQAQTQLIDDLLDTSSVMQGQLRLDVRPVKIADVVAHAVETIRPAATAKAIDVQTTIDVATGLVHADPERLQQILWNLLSNAVKFTPHGGHVAVRATQVGGDVEIAVSDTGRGISPEFLPYVFDRFRQQESGSTRGFGGLGLGLSIVRSLVEMHGGTITAHSDGPGRGTTLTLWIPSGAARAGAALTGESALAAGT